MEKCPKCGQSASAVTNKLDEIICSQADCPLKSEVIQYRQEDSMESSIDILDQEESIINVSKRRETKKETVRINRPLHLAAGTVEEAIDLDWKKQIAQHALDKRKKNTEGKRYHRSHREGEDNSRRRKTGKKPRKYPKHYKYIFYSVLFGIPFILLCLVIWKLQGTTPTNPDNQIEQMSPQAIWNHADGFQRDAFMAVKTARRFKDKDPVQYKANLKKAIEFYDKAIKYGQMAVDKRIEALKEQGMDDKKAREMVEDDIFIPRMRTWKEQKAKQEKEMSGGE